MKIDDTYRRYFNLHDATFELVEHEDATVGIVYKVIVPDGKCYILKISKHTRHYTREKYFLSLLKDTSFAPRIIDYIEPKPDLYGALLIEYVPGRLLTLNDYAKKLVYEVGSILARIHCYKFLGFGDPSNSKDFIHEARLYLSQEFEEGFSECKDYLPALLLKRIRAYYESHSSFLRSVDDACLMHNDFRPGNILICDNGGISVIDWASSRAGLAQEDFYYIESGDWHFSSGLKKDFFAGYASVCSVPDYSHILPLLCLSKALNILGFTFKNDRWKDDLSKLYEAKYADIQKLLG